MIRIDEVLLKKYFSRQCTAEEEQAVLDYLTAPHPDYAMLHALFSSEAVHIEPEVMPHAMARNLAKALKKAVAETRPDGKLVSMRAVYKRWYLAGAAAVLIPLMIAGYRMAVQSPAAKNKSNAAAAIAADKAKRLINSSSETRLAVMPDGTHIWLMAYSSVSYHPVQYATQQREVYLEGEAFFEVAQNQQQPFSVKHGNLVTQVLGTTFNMEAYEEERSIRVALMQGKVAVQSLDANGNTSARQMLNPGQMLSYRKATGAMNMRRMLTNNEDDYRKGYFVLNDIPLSDALHRIERKYHTHIQVSTADIADRRVTAVFKSGTAAEILQNILFIHGLHFKIQGDTVRITR
ncbi:FecR family protein [Deminuibacter soli]|uniref:DUF4974 domain-containing protein n=1 Tax=Deminuibacter soli TaxID=2291815 RepID=A0A3E1NP03_9BACT|nr:FecR domain-containing protein [Deminuibacter soli]RFM29554.1 DUF4974 domain-containing protein [Deminuibacter soli]